jgi:hypothetical protein
MSAQEEGSTMLLDYPADQDGPRLYLASRWSRRAEMQSHAAELEALGLARVEAAWLREPHDWDGESEPAARSLALDDYRDLSAADAVIAFTEAPGGCRRGGRHVELGLALGLGRRVIIVGPIENVFCAMPGIIRFERWSNCLAWLVRSSGDYWWEHRAALAPIGR